MLSSIFEKTSLVNFKIRASVYCLLVDLITSYSIYGNLSKDHKVYALIFKSAEAQGIAIENFTTEQLNSLAQNFRFTLKSLLIGFIVYHLVIYTLLFFDRPFARKYLIFYTSTGAVFMMAYSLYQSAMGDMSELIYLPMVLMFAYVYLGLNYYKKHENIA